MPKHISIRTIVLILQTGYKLQAKKCLEQNIDLKSDVKIKYSDIIDAIGTDHFEGYIRPLHRAPVKKWWDYRSVFAETGKIEHQKRSGRPTHPSFDSEEKIENVIEDVTNWGIGYHRQDALDKYNCSKNTFRRHTKDKIVLVLPPKEHAYDNEEVKRKRVQFAKFCLTRLNNLKRLIRNATFVDHKYVGFYGLNRTHARQYKRIGETYENVEPLDYELHNPSIMAYFACNRNGVKVFIHATKRRKRRGQGYTVDKRSSIDSDDVIEAFDEEFVAFMQQTNSNYVIADGVKIQHTQSVKNFLRENDLQMHPSNCHPHNTANGYPPYSHCFNPLDYRVFAPFQREISQLCRERNADSDDTKYVYLYDIIKSTFETDKYANLARDCINNYGNICKNIIQRKGDIKNFK